MARLVIGKNVPEFEAYCCLASVSIFAKDTEVSASETATEARLDVPGRTSPITGLAVARYLSLDSDEQKQAGSKGSGADGSSASPLIDDRVLRAAQQQQIWSSLDKVAIANELKSLDSELKGHHDFVIAGSKELTLADIHVFYGLVCSHTIAHPELLEGLPELRRYLENIGKNPIISTVTDKATSLGLTAVCYPPDQLLPKREELGTYYLTTAINYTNGSPHIGHAYEIVVSDVLTRYHRTFGRDVFFLTGTDEHGQKIANVAEERGIKPIDLCTKYADEFRQLNEMLTVTNVKFGRTTNPEHYRSVRKLWRLSRANVNEKGESDIYLGKYVGWYSVREETFVTEYEAGLTDFKDPVSGQPYKKMSEESYFFRMSRYQDRLVKHIEENPTFIQPAFRRAEILQRLKDPLLDLSVSRSSFSWGVPVPDDDKHVMYVWFDALTNYITGVGFGDDETSPVEKSLSKYWPANCHMIGKDITWFHTVIWPCILMSAGVQLPKCVFSHGFVVAGDGKKMSKSLGNIVDPVATLSSGIPADTFRFYIAKGAELGQDMRFCVESLYDSHNSDLADTIGNLLHRTTTLIQKFCDGKIPDVSVPSGPPPFNFVAVAGSVERCFSQNRTQQALEIVMNAARDTNKYLTNKAPWAIKDDDVLRQQICKAVAEALYILAHFLEPFVPTGAGKIFERLGTPASVIVSLSQWFDNLKAGTPVTVGDVLYEKLEKPATA